MDLIERSKYGKSPNFSSSSPIFFFIFQQLRRVGIEVVTIVNDSANPRRGEYGRFGGTPFHKTLQIFNSAPSSDEFDVEAVLAGATRQAAASTRSRYKPTKHVSPTGNMCESLFSVRKHTMTDYRRHMGPEKLEATLILRCNYDLWQGQIGQKLIQEIMNDEKAARKAAADQARNAAVAAVAAVAADDELDGFSGITDDTGY